MTTTEKTVRLTNRYALNAAINALNGEPVPADFAVGDIVEKLNGMIAQLDKKNAAPRKLTKTQEQNAVIRAEVVEFLKENAPTGFTCGDLIKAVPVLHERSNQYVSALMKIAVDGGEVAKYTDKRKSYFRAV
jgi:hypothetical protein